MPSELVHLAIAGLVALALLGPEFDRRSLAVVLAAAAVPDLDTFAGLVLAGAHRSLLHTLVLPAILGGVLWADTRSPGSFLRTRFGDRGVRIAWVALVALLFGGIAPDLFTNGVNAFYPLHDTFYTVNGKLLLSDQRGVVQTFVELEKAPTRTTQNTHYWTGVDPTPGDDPKRVERIFPVVQSGLELLVVLLSSTLLTLRVALDRRA